ncbi:DUF92 domain-containing protein [Alkalicoccus luteus]|uniref:DUF92 domain-containing protein n=1 Tax=Alkalicoccus luteus TaxID=1237094 RepID=A0A969TV67_9BACI|nr:DUF92 domain-containing protein [Alkalicoccus luteus]NJP37671.1 DUF92 domain-containing protein [Alkalicoccus luteus]
MIASLAACIAAAAAYACRLLTITGLAAALAVGLSVSLLGWNGLYLLGFFFISSYLLERIFRPAEEVEAKGARRDGTQVIANGGAAALAAIIYSIYPSEAALTAFAAALSAAASDTWASAAGKSAQGPAVLIFSRKRVDAGISGGITVKGTSWAFAGAILTAAAAQLLFTELRIEHAILIAAAGFTGQLIDSAAGEKMQLLYKCPQCGTLTEKTEHCRRQAMAVKGISGINNDMVNLIATSGAAVLAGIYVMLFT